MTETETEAGAATTFRYHGGYRAPAVPAPVAAAELARLRDRDGHVTAPAVVEAARPPDAPLHRAFQWDDTAAADEYRMMQARQLIRAIVMVVPHTQESMRVYVHVPPAVRAGAGGTGYYQPMTLLTEGEYERAAAALDVKLRAAEASAAELTRAARNPVQIKRATRVRRGLALARGALAAAPA